MLPARAPRAPRDPLAFPRAPRPEEIERGERRRTLALPAPAAEASSPQLAEELAPVAALHDPLHVALPSADFAVVVEAGTLLASPAGRLLLGCLSPPQAETLRGMEARTGFPPLEQLDRIALADSSSGRPMLVVSGDFSALDLARLADEALVERVGAKAQVVVRDAQAVAVWDRRLLLVGEPDGVREGLRRLDGEVAALPSSLAEEMYGEVYGALNGEALRRFLPAELGTRVRDAAERVLVHVDATDDLLLVAEVHGTRAEALVELRQALAGALAMGRLQAVRDEDRLLADLLDESRVIPGDGSFQLEVALPLATIEAALGDCARPPAAAEPAEDPR